MNMHIDVAPRCEMASMLGPWKQLPQCRSANQATAQWHIVPTNQLAANLLPKENRRDSL